jgi:hypothetical protein
MTASPAHAEAERRLRDLLASSDLPAPDEVAHLQHAVLFVWHAAQVLVIAELDQVDAVDLDALALDLCPLDLDALELDAIDALEVDPDPLDPFGLDPLDLEPRFHRTG